MLKYSKDKLNSYLVKGKLHEAVDYLSKFSDKKDEYEMYINTFEKSQYYQRANNEVLGSIDRIYQNYYRDVFWRNLSKEDAKRLLFYELWLFCGSKTNLPKDENIEYEIGRVVKLEGYEYLGGSTQGFYGPYIWKSSTKATYEVELPSGIEPYTIIMMDGFISRSWLDFISFGNIGPGGWTDKDGILCCVRSLYKIESNDFKISFLKHEAQHAYDRKNYPDITATDLEYRAKLVELIYWSNDERIKEICREADNSNPKNSHSVAAYRIMNEMSKKIFESEYINDEKVWKDSVDYVKKYALELLEESKKTLELGNML